MINIDATDVLEGIASVDAVIKFTLSGHDSTSGVISKEGTVANTNTELYTAVGITRIYSVTFYNSHSAAVTITLNKDPANAGTLYPIFAISLGIGYSLVFDGARITVMDAQGRIQTGVGGIAIDPLWAAAGDLVQGTGNNAAAILSLGTAYQVPAVNAGADAIAYVDGETPWVDYLSSSTIVGWETPEGVIYTKKIGKVVFVAYSITGTSNSETTSFTLPYSILDYPHHYYGYAVDNTGTPGFNSVNIDAETNIVYMGKNLLGNVWTTSGTKTIRGQFFCITT